jgi:hypothetical protein
VWPMLVTFRNVVTGEHKPVKVRAWDKNGATVQAVELLAAELGSVELADPWEVRSVRRTEE